MPVTAQDIAAAVGGRLTGPADLVVHAVEELERAEPGHLVFIRDRRHAGAWAACRARVALVSDQAAAEPGEGRAVIAVADVDLALARVLEMLAPPAALPEPGVHPRATVDAGAQLGPDVRIGAGCFVGAGAVIGRGTVLHPNVTVMDQAVIGADCLLYPGVVIRDRCLVGDRCILHPNVVIGGDGFGYRPAPDGRGLVKLPHIGIVRLGQDVEIGAGTTIDRGKFSATEVGDGSKIDNLCQIGHNCRIGRGCILAAQVGLAGSVTVGDGAMLGGKVGVRDHTTIGAGAQLAAYAAVMGDVPAGAVWAGYPAQDFKATFRQVAAMRRLPDVLRKLKE